jgi:hypothetical protein
MSSSDESTIDDNEIPALSFIRLGQSLTDDNTIEKNPSDDVSKNVSTNVTTNVSNRIQQNKTDVANEAQRLPLNEQRAVDICIDCVTKWVTKYLGNTIYIHFPNGTPVWGGPVSSRPTISEVVTDCINDMVEYYKRHRDTPSAPNYRNIYNELLESYNSLDYNTIEQRWRIFSTNPDNIKLMNRSWEGYSPQALWQAEIITQSVYRMDRAIRQSGGSDRFFSLTKYLNSEGPKSIFRHWGPEGSSASPPYINPVLRAYIKCFLILMKTFFPDYPDIIGGSKKKRQKTKRKYNKKRSKKTKRKRTRRY